MRRFYDDQPFIADQPTGLSAGPSHHIGRVLRMAVGDPLVVFNGQGGEWLAKIVAMDKKTVTVTPHTFIDADRAPPLAVHLGLPMIKGERMDYALQKATEMGVRRITVLDTQHGEVRLKGERLEKKRSQWQHQLISACEQCGLNRVPELVASTALNDWVNTPLPGLKLIAHPGEAAFDPAALHSASEVALLTGPEGGFSSEELDQARASGFQGFALGERVLRAETAPVALLGALWAWCG